MNDPVHPEEAIFEAAFALPVSERAAYLDQTCGGNAGLRQLVEALLEAHEEAGEFLESPAPGAEPSLAAGHRSPRAGSETPGSPIEKPGDRIGRYKLLQQIGEGGCGVVYMAEQQEPVRRMVALKVIKLGMDTKQVIARFEAERQALAVMDHPNIAKVLDAGATETGRPYFVMELVRGIKITDYCDQNNLPTRERLDLFVQVCEAVQHAHQKGVIHRDIKPSNILLTLRDGVPVPKVIDFGIAKATTDQRLTDKTLFTAFEQFIGTPAYMSPEQAEMSELGIDTRSDIYSLGVLLYELLTGQTPFDAKELLQAGLEAMRRIIREKEPARPSTRLGTLLEVEKTSVANHRQTDVLRLMHLLRGDLDWIVIKSLEKDRARRYATANGLAMDVQRYLANEPIVARPPSKLYRVQKLIRRNQLTFAAGAGVAIALLAGLSVSTWQFVEKSRGYRRLREAEGEQRRLLKETQRAQEEEAGLRQKAEAEVYTADMNLALQAWREGNMERARALLRTYLPEPGKADLRGFEWRYLWNLFQDESQRSFTNFSGEVRSLALSPDGRLLAAGGHNVVRLIEIAITQEIDELRNPIEWVNGGAFSPTSKDVFATAGAEGLVKLWNLRTKELVATLVGYPSGINSITFSPNGKRLAAAGWGTTLQVWDVERQTSLWTRSTRYPTQVAVFTPDGSALVSGGGKVGNALVWEVETGKEMAPLPPEHKLWLESCAFSPDGTTLATGSIDSQIILWDFATRRRRAILLGHLGPVLSVAFSPDGNRVVSGGADETVRVWDAASGRQIALLRGHEGPVGAVVFSPDGTTVFSGSGDSTVKVWRPSLRSESQIVKARGTCITSVAFSPSGTLLAFVDYDEALTTLCDVASAGAIADFPGSSLGGYSVAFSPSGEMLAAGSEDYLVRLWHVASRNRLCVFTNDFPAGSICFSPDNRVVAAAGKTLAVRKERNTLAFWDIASRRKLVRLAGAAPEACVVAWANDGRFVAVGYWRGEVQVWDFVKDKVVSKFNEHKGAVFQVAFSSDGRYLASVGDDAGVVLYDLSAQRAFKLSGHTSWVLSVAFAPDDKTLVTTGVDGTIRFWNITTREIALILRDHVGPVGGVAFTLKGDRMASSGMDGTVRLWTAASLPRAP